MSRSSTPVMDLHSLKNGSGSLHTDPAVEPLHQDNSKQQMEPSQNQPYELAEKFHLHCRSEGANQFPIHLYFRQRYEQLTYCILHLSLHQQVIYFRQYLEVGNCNQRPNIPVAHIEILNQGINLFIKVPQRPLVFLFIEPYSESEEVVTLKNYSGQIIHYQIVEKTKKRSTLLAEIKRKMKDRVFMIVKDSGNLSPQSNTLTIKTIHKLDSFMKFLYIRTVSCSQEMQALKAELVNQHLELEDGEQCKFSIDLNEQACLLRIYSLDKGQEFDFNSDQPASFQKQLEQRAQQLAQEQREITLTNTQWGEWGFRLRIFDTLFINFLKSGQSKQKLIQIIDKKSKKYMPSLSNANTQHHFPGRLLKSMRCKYCETVGLQTIKKSKYKCIGCSIHFSTDIPLCIRCWGNFHEHVLPVCLNSTVKNFRRTFEARVELHPRSMPSNSGKVSHAQVYVGQKTVPLGIFSLQWCELWRNSRSKIQ